MTGYDWVRMLSKTLIKQCLARAVGKPVQVKRLPLSSKRLTCITCYCRDNRCIIFDVVIDVVVDVGTAVVVVLAIDEVVDVVIDVVRGWRPQTIIIH